MERAQLPAAPATPTAPSTDTAGRHRRRRTTAVTTGLATLGLLAGTLAALAGGGSALASSVAPTAAGGALTSNWYASAPYLMPEDNSAPDAGAVMDASGQKAFQLAFMLDSGGCNPAWGGTSSIDTDTTIPAVIQQIRAKGGDVSVSFGGYGGNKLGQGCGTPEATAAAEQKVITKYGLHAIDFDLEEPEYENSAAIHNEIGAAKILQANNPGIYISITTAGTTAGTGWFGTQMLNEAKSQGFTPNNYSIMPFDGGFNGGAAQVAALTSFNSILQTTFGWSAATAYAHEGVSMMNGRTDAAEYFSQADFQTVLNFATANGLARYTFWSVNRDRQCTPVVDPGLSGSCSGVVQNPWDFTKYTVQFAGATPPTTPPTSAPPTSASPGICTLPAWSASSTYTNGDKVSYNGHDYHAKWWTQNEVPTASGQYGVWADDGPC
ncbi:carbohydrate-binding protein [Kitasatospora sp. GAS204B]|uniref:carbohydrate-binding protein n=1 Tax=unclassified Kitasatospora TaxID=2633591 RepID=UPI0024752B8D|nr:carbohydrate-binding protein [Kitasatospora sp. GAS204B]MDH6119969.1 chitinase [Kitasatospora sp. GAS204B]